MKRSDVMSERDLRLFRYLYEFKVATSRQICRDVFNKIHHCNVYRRLNTLIKFGYIESKFVDAKSGRCGYALSIKGYRKFINDSTSCIREQHKSEHLEHDIGLNDVINRFKNLQSVKQVYTENVLQSGSDFIRALPLDAYIQMRCDGLLVLNGDVEIQNGERRIEYLPLELEINEKSSARYEDLITRYYLKFRIPNVVYIAGSERILEKVMTIEKNLKSSHEPKFYFCLLNEVLEENNLITLRNYKDQTLILK